MAKGSGAGDLDELFVGPGRRSAAAAGAPKADPGGLSADLNGLVRQYEDVGREAERIASGLSDRQFNWRSSSGRWSIAECFGHLNIVGSELLPRIDGAIGQARGHAWYRKGPLRVGFVGRRLIAAAEPPARRKRRARPDHVAAGDQAIDLVLPALLDLNRQLGMRAKAASGLDITRPKVTAFGARVFRPSLYELFLVLAAHERRHLRQAQAVKDDPGFPRGRAAGPVAPRPPR
ncbi:MAG: DinB family protein [Thermoanaerobaculaceae bacterium]|nr:DinB family protein [Thermoanaerobaculaceae bacterium]